MSTEFSEFKIFKVATQLEMNILLKLLQNYEAEFSSITLKTPDDNGEYQLDTKLEDSDNFLLFKTEKPIGFAVKGITDSRHDILEFYIVPAIRGSHIGRWFASEIFRKYQGEWQVRQIEGATKAVSFWRQAISEYTNNNYEENIVTDSYWGTVTRQTFSS